MALGIDVGGSKILALKIKGEKVLKKWRLETRRGYVMEDLRRIIEEAGEDLVGVGFPGYIRKNICVKCPNIPEFNDKNLKDLFGKVVVLNDCTAMAYGEYVLREEKYDPLLLIALGTGVGSGLVYGGKPYVGRGSALEIGHLKGFSNKKCQCGKTGCLETVLGGRYNDVQLLARKAREGDKNALEFFEEYGKNLALAISHAIHILDPEIIVIGGGISKSYDLFIPYVKESLQNLLSFIDVEDIIFERAKSEESAALGVAYIAQRELL